MNLYRYRNPSVYLRSEILKGEIFFSPVNSMNDFYDSFYRHSEEGDLDKHIENLKGNLLEHAREVIRRGPDGTNDIQKNIENKSQINFFDWANNILNTPGYLEQNIENLRQDFKNNPDKIAETTKLQNKNADLIRSKTSICCLSKKKLCLSMFGYYADDGKGVMLAYENIGNKVKDVRYVPTLPVLKVDTPFEEGIEMQVFHKLECWSHEEEVRISAYESNGVHTDHGLKLIGVYCGPRISDAFKECIYEWSGAANIPVYEHSQGENGNFLWKILK